MFHVVKNRCITQGAQPGALRCPRGVGSGLEEAQEGGDICIILADLHCRVAETKGFPGSSVIKNPLAMQETRV